MDTQLGQAWRERTKIISQHGRVVCQCQNLYGGCTGDLVMITTMQTQACNPMWLWEGGQSL